MSRKVSEFKVLTGLKTSTEEAKAKEVATQPPRENWNSYSLKDLMPEDPYVTKDYTGFLPEYKTQYGSSCAKATSNLINQQSVENPNARRLFPDINDYSNSRDYPLPEELEYLRSRTFKEVPLTKYTGFVPGSKYHFGERQAAIQARCLVKVKKDVANYNENKKAIQQYVDLIRPKTPKQKIIDMKDEHAMPPPKQTKTEYNPYFSGPRDPHKFFIAGYQGHVPSYKQYAGIPNRIAMQYGLVNFHNNLLRAKKAEGPTTNYARSLEVDVRPPEPPSGGLLYPPQYPDIYRPQLEEHEEADPIRYQELEKFFYLTGFSNRPPKK